MHCKQAEKSIYTNHRILVYASLSLGEQGGDNVLTAVSGQPDAVIVFREIPAGMNLGQGIKAIQALAAKKDPVPNIIINPTLFKTYNIIAVPTIVILEDELLPGCSSVLNGVRFPFDRTNQGHHGMGDMDGGDGSFMHYHYYAFPLMVMLDLFIKQASNPDGYMDLDIMYMSELDPTWNNNELAFFSNPEAAAVANPIAAAACTADAVSVTAGKPLN